MAYSTPLDIRCEQGIENGKFVVKLFSEMLGTASSNIALNFTYASSGLSFSDVSFAGSSAVSSSLSSSNGNGTVSISGQFVPNGIAALPFAKLFFAGSGTGSFNIDFSRLALNAVSQTYIDPPATTYDLRVVAGSDTIPPTVTTFFPSSEANNVAIGSNIVVTFNEAITKGTGNILLKTIGGSTQTLNPADIGYVLELLSKSITGSELYTTLGGNTGGTIIASYDAATSPNITVSGSTLTLNPTADLTAGTRYVVEFQAGSVKDLAGNNFAGNSSYNFATAAPVGRVLSGTNGNDTLFGTIGQSEIINALGGDDRITIGGDEVSDSVSGGDGFDTVVFTNDKADYLISKSPSSGSYDVISKRGVVNFINRDVERLEFRDGTVDPSTSKYYGTVAAELPGSVSSVFRFFNINDNAFFYTNSVSERNTVLANSDVSRNNVNEWSYIYQGSSFEAAHTYAGAVPLERFYNTLTKHHFFTSSQSEAATVKANSASGAWPFVYEGVSFNVYANDPTPNSVGQEIPVERFYSAVLNRHWFTADPTEIAQIRLTGLWVDEGVGYWAEKPGP